MTCTDIQRGPSHLILVGAVFFLFQLILFPGSLQAQDIAQVKKGVVKISAQAEGKTKVGTGFVVRVDKDATYIVTAAHVVEGDSKPTVTFSLNLQQPFVAQVVGIEGGDPQGLAALRVAGLIPDGVVALPLDLTTKVVGGETLTFIGFPGTLPPWTVSKGSLSGMHGPTLAFQALVEEGHSGGPLLLNGLVIGVVSLARERLGYAVPASILSVALTGWGIEPRPSDSMARQGQIGKDGAPMVLIPSGGFLMGSTKDEVDRAVTDCVKEAEMMYPGVCMNLHNPEFPQHKVRIDSFYLDKYEVTNLLFKQFVQQAVHRTTAELKGSANVFVEGRGWEEIKGANWQNPEGAISVFQSGREAHPVVTVSWDDADAYCRWAGKRLPTEAEFEYAMRAGTTSKYWWGPGNPGSRRVENIGDDSAKNLLGSTTPGYDDGAIRTAPVGSYEANPWGLHDLSGNVAEWVADWYDENYYKTSPVTDPKGPSSGQNRMVRGGSWPTGFAFAGSAFRLMKLPTWRVDAIGFRCAQDVSN